MPPTGGTPNFCTPAQPAFDGGHEWSVMFARRVFTRRFYTTHPRYTLYLRL